MDLFRGKKLSLKIDALENGDPTKVAYPIGTEVILKRIQNNKALIEFPDEQIFAHELKDLPLMFVEMGTKTHERVTKGLGTPPRALFPYMPSEARWNHNYMWTVKITLEEQGKKAYICQDCYTELTGNETTLVAGIMCPECQKIKTPLAVDTILPE